MKYQVFYSSEKTMKKISRLSAAVVIGTLTLKHQTKIAAEDTLIFLLLSFEENKALFFM